MKKDYNKRDYKFSEIHALNQKFFNIFGVYFEPYMDKMMSLFLFNKPTLCLL